MSKFCLDWSSALPQERGHFQLRHRCAHCQPGRGLSTLCNRARSSAPSMPPSASNGVIIDELCILDFHAFANVLVLLAGVALSIVHRPHHANCQASWPPRQRFSLHPSHPTSGARKVPTEATTTNKRPAMERNTAANLLQHKLECETM